MLEVIVNPLLGTQALNERQIGLPELHTIFTLRVMTAQPKLEAVALNPLPHQHQRNDLRHGLVLENTLMAAVHQVGQLRHKANLVARKTSSGIALGHPVNQAVHAMAAFIKTQIHLAMQHPFQVDIGLLADQLKLKTIRLAERLLTFEAIDFKVARNAIQG